MKKILFLLLAVIFIQFNTLSVYATSKYELLEPLPGFENVPHNKFADYVIALYSLSIWIAGFCAMTVLVVAGFIYVTSAGNPNRISKAKNYITDALLGLAAVFFSWMILNVINPDLTKIEDNLALFKTASTSTTSAREEAEKKFRKLDDFTDNKSDTEGEHGGPKNVKETTKSVWICRKDDGSKGPAGRTQSGNIDKANDFCKSIGYPGAYGEPILVECKNGALVNYASQCGQAK